MKDQVTSACAEDKQGLQNLLTRVKAQSLHADFQVQRENALRLVLQPYLDPLTAQYLAPLPEEMELAESYLYSDYFPTDGRPSLVEQVRDTITEHIPEEERRWLDPVRHSYMDLLQIVEVDQETHPSRLHLQSLGDQQHFDVPYMEKPPVQKDHVLLTRLIRGTSGTYLPAPPLVLSLALGRALLALTHDLRQNIEFGTGNFALAEWPEFASTYGYLLIWGLAQLRGGTIANAEDQVTYWKESGERFLYAVTLYEHHEFATLASELDQWEHLDGQALAQDFEANKKRVWLHYGEKEHILSDIKTRLILTPTQITVETNSANQLDKIKHELASRFGFRLHFRGETLTTPLHSPPHIDLLSDQYVPPPVTVSPEEEHKLLSTFLETAYLEWAEQPSPALNGKTPRQYCRESQSTTDVAELINQMERNDLGLQRTGQQAYDYSILRAHIGL